MKIAFGTDQGATSNRAKGEEPAPPRRYDAILFDLLTALLDSWTLWSRVAGGHEQGMRWRMAYLKITYGTNHYRPYETLLREAAERAGLPLTVADMLIASWTELQPWPEASAVLRQLAKRAPLGLATNCSEVMGRQAADRVGVPFETVVTAESAGYYKPAPAPYEMALSALGVNAESVLFVAGSPADVAGASAVGMQVAWHNRAGLRPLDATRPQFMIATLDDLLDLVE